jgi:hypothetical protein
MRRLALLMMAAVGLAYAGSIAFAATPPSGTAVGVNPSAVDQSKLKSKDLVVGADVAMGDKIVTGATGQVQLLFTDNTKLVVGPSSSLVVESYLLRGDKTVGTFAVNALSGTFRFITGSSDHSAYTINTPTGTIGVRGTAFDFRIDPEVFATDGTSTPGGHNHKHKPGSFLTGTTVALFRGAVVLCNLDNECETLTNKCEVGAITTPETFKIGRFDAAEEGLRSKFTYVASQKPLLPSFWVDESRFCFINTDTNGTGLGSFSGGAEPPKPRFR